MPQKWQTVAIPFAQGIKPTSQARVLEQTGLLTAQNCFFLLDQGPQKRYGHDTRPVKTQDPPVGLQGTEPPAAPSLRSPFSFDNPGLSESFLLGYGIVNDGTDPVPGEWTMSNEPFVGNLFGGWTRDSEAVLWDGHRALSYPNTHTGPFGEVSGQAVMPALRGAPIAKSLSGQYKPDAVDNGKLRTVAWIHGGDVYRSVFDSVSGACLINEEVISFTDAKSLRVLAFQAWTHIIVSDNDTELFIKSWHNDTPQTVISRTLGQISTELFDVRKFNEQYGVVAKINGDDITITIIKNTGALYIIYNPDIGGDTPVNVSIATHITDELAVIWQTAAKDTKFRKYELFSGATISGVIAVGATSDALGRITVAENYLLKSGSTAWSVYIDDNTTTNTARQVRMYSVVTSATLKTTRYNTTLATHAFRAGQRSYVWCAGAPTIFELQPTWFLCDEKLQPVGKVLFGLGYDEDPTSSFAMRGVQWCVNDSAHPLKDVLVFTGCHGYRQRANTNTDSATPNGVWLEPSIFFYTLDFLSYVRATQAGRATVIAGAQLWEYDGANLNEAGFHLAPENFTLADGGAGNLDEEKVYSWRIDLCYKNAQNEEIRSWSTTVSSTASETPGTFKATLTIPHVPMTRRDKSYFLIFRTEGNGTEYYLCSSRNPADSGASANGFLFNDRGSAQYTFTDNLSDTSLIAREYHPVNATGWLQPLPAPACEIVAAGRDRIWLAGGELSPSEVAPSRYFVPGETPAWTPALNIQIDRNAEPITAVGFVGEVAVFFRKTSTYTLESDGPDNTNQGVWAYPRLALADVGATAQETLALAGEGLYFQSRAGIRVITSGGGLRPPGAGLIGGLGTDVDVLAAEGNYAAAVVFPLYSQIRWYSRDVEKPAIVVDYTKNVWTTWTGLECQSALYWAPGNTVVISRADGQVWTENTSYLDGDKTYETIVKTAWLHGQYLGDFERVKRFALFGNASDGLSLRIRVYYDERDFHEQEEFVDFIGEPANTDFNPSKWGGIEWGYGPWGDESREDDTGVGSGLYFRDDKFRFRKRLDRQKCSVMSIEFSDQGSDAEFTPVVLALELGLKEGLDRI